MRLCQYRNMLGAPKTGLHSYRLFDIAIVDVILTIILAYVISLIWKWPFTYVLLFLFVFGTFLHYIFCVQTTIIKLIFGN